MLAYLARCPRYSNKPKGAVAVLFLSLPASSFYSVGASWNSILHASPVVARLLGVRVGVYVVVVRVGVYVVVTKERLKCT